NKAMPYKVLKIKILEILIVYITQLREIGINQKIIDKYLIIIVEEIELKKTFKDLMFWIKKLFDQSESDLNILFKDNVYAIIKKAEHYIIENYNQKDISLVLVAEYLNISSFYLSHLFKKVNNINFNKYLNKIRLEEAQKLLMISDRNVREISDMVGYSDPNYFTKKFKEVYGYPPLTYRKAMQDIHV
ncbi:MAG: helix-turn-helix transcriptional regulator, partial [Clostridiales bacterium]|nr:helix-turn-helix transcriptional regulator [Clostridiales bacterium]